MKDNKNIESLMEYFSQIIFIDNNRHEEFEAAVLKMGFLIYELNRWEYFVSLLNRLNRESIIYRVIETLHLISKSQVMYLKVEAN